MKTSIQCCLILMVVSFLAVGCSELKHTYPMIEKGRSLTFPRDHYAHREFRTEWWYYSGQLDGEDGSRYGFELVFFVRRTDEDRVWGIPGKIWSNPAHLAHFGIVDLQKQKLVYSEKRTPDYIHRGYDAGALEDAFNVWNKSWSAKGIGNSQFLQADMKDYALSLELTPAKPFVLHGENGYFVKAQPPDHPRGTYYIAFTRLIGEGTLTVNKKPVKVQATAWMDHEFGSRQLGKDQLGWDWFSLQFNDGTELMLYLLKQKDGTHGLLSKGSFIDADGKKTNLPMESFSAEPLRTWISEKSGGSYHLEWKIRVEPLDMEIHVRPMIDNAELNTRRSTMVVYWEGPVEASGARQGKEISARGYMELCGDSHPVNFLTENRTKQQAAVN